MKTPRVLAIVAAAGQGRRFGGGKQWSEVNGRVLVDWSIDRMLDVAERVVVAVPENSLENLPSQYAEHERVSWLPGGASRWQSVRRAFASLEGEGEDLVAVHDGARPATSASDIAAVIEAAASAGAAVLGRPAVDTMKRVSDGRILSTVERGELFRAETPQVLRYSLFERCVELVADDASDPTDESSIVERMDGVSITAVAARHPNPKITEPGDLALVSSLLSDRE